MESDMVRAGVLALAVLAGGCASAALRPGPEGRFPTEGPEAAWDRLSGGPARLPAWARALVDPLPSTAAWQVNLDFLHRKRNPLGPKLAGKIRWVVADANRCAYAKESAEADLAKAGLSPEDVARLADPEAAEEKDRAVLAFARRLTLEASALTDGEVADLLAALGPEDVVAVVHTVAHANFQDRLFLGLGLSAEPGGATPPVEVRPPGADEPAARPRTPPPAGAEAAAAGGEGVPPWEPRSPGELRELLELQKARTARIPEPDGARRARLPRPLRDRPRKTAWGWMTMPYQPEMTAAWFRTMEAFEEEADLDEVFASSVFWVVTRTSGCFY